MKETKFYKDYMNDVYPLLKKYFDKRGTPARYRGDLFLKYALTKKLEILIRLCEDLSYDKIKSIKILHTHLASSSLINKQLRLDFYIEDDKHRYYNLEFQNYDMTLGERKRINYYGIRMMNEHINQGQSYMDVPDFYQAIYYLGNPLSMFNGFVDDYLKCIRSSSLPYDGENLTSKIYTIQRIDKHLESKTNLTFTEQLCYLLLHDVPYPYEEADELIKEVIKMLRAFNNDEERWKAYDEEDDKKFDNTLIAEAKIEAREQAELKKDIEHSKLLADNLRGLIKTKFFYVSPYVEKHIVKANFEALNKAIAALYTIHNPDDLIPILES